MVRNKWFNDLGKTFTVILSFILSLIHLLSQMYYLPQTNLWEVNVYSRVCLSFCSPGVGGESRYRTFPPPRDRLKHVQLRLHYTGTPIFLDRFKLVHWEEQTVCKRAVGIPLKCLLVYFCTHSTTYLPVELYGG